MQDILDFISQSRQIPVLNQYMNYVVINKDDFSHNLSHYLWTNYQREVFISQQLLRALVGSTLYTAQSSGETQYTYIGKITLSNPYSTDPRNAEHPFPILWSLIISFTKCINREMLANLIWSPSLISMQNV